MIKRVGESRICTPIRAGLPATPDRLAAVAAVAIEHRAF
jgi:hypothetical protein